MSIKNLEINSKKIQLMKPLTGANYEAKTVLTDSAWEYVELWLRRKKGENAKEALFYWMQAKYFFNASENLPIESRPLTSYYCCLNAAKALLAIGGAKEIILDNIIHGISSDREQWKTSNIKDAEVIFGAKGVLPELSNYLKEEVGKKVYNVYDLIYNIPCVHRAFSITYNCTELFIPIRDVQYVVDTEARKGWVQFQVEDSYANGNSLISAPHNYEKVKYNDDGRYLMRSKKKFKWDIHGIKKDRMEALSKFHGSIRKDILYINGDTRLWYLKKELPNNPHVLKRNSVTLIFAVMHWLSELVRYNPMKFSKVMNSKQNWLIHEFVDNALYQFVDEVACEITKADIMVNGYRK